MTTALPLDEQVEKLKDLLASYSCLVYEWGPNAVCPQCGKFYTDGMCGFTHAAVRMMIENAEDYFRPGRPLPWEK